MEYSLKPESMQADVIKERSLLYLRLRWANLFALVAISVFGVIDDSNITITLTIVGLSALLNLSLYFYIKFNKSEQGTVKLLSYLVLAQIILDFMVISLVAFLSGNPPNQYALVYVMPILVSSALFSRTYLYATAAIGSLCYLASNYPNVLHWASNDTNGDSAPVALMYVLALFVLAYLADILFAEKHKKEVENAQLEMISLVSHQLRTPASAVKGFLSFLLEGYGGKLAPKQLEFIEKANTENDIQINLVDNILNVAKVDLNKIKINPVTYSLKTLVEDVLTEYEANTTARKQQVKFVCHLDDSDVRIDPQLMRMVVDNLVSNAIKYGGEKAKINITISGNLNTVSLNVEDNGLGIPQKEQNKVFKRFHRVVAKVEGEYVEGSGLGLYLAKRLVELHHGTISLVSYPGEGTLITINLKRI